MLRKRLACGPVARERGDRRRHRGGVFGGQIVPGRIGLKVFELQLHLIEEAAGAFGAGTILLAPQLGDLQLEVCDHRFDGALAGVGVGKLRLSLVSLLERGNQQRLERFNVVRKGRTAASMKVNESSSTLCCKRKVVVPSDYPALAGRHEYCGLRQAIPSSRQASCEGVSDTVPSFAEGHKNRPLSSRLA